MALSACQIQDEKEKISNTEETGCIRTYEDAYKLITNVRTERKEKIECYIEDLINQAKSVHDDTLMRDFFFKQMKCVDLEQENNSDNAKKSLSQSEKNILIDHVRNYNLFYDILFINKDGCIFHTILKQKDYRKNLWMDDLARTELSKKIKQNPVRDFVDFQYYECSDEYSAFIVEPVYENKTIVGWYAFQVAINKINNLLSDYKNLLKTGEVLLVNKEQYFMCDSRFETTSAIFEEKISNDNLLMKFKTRSGNSIVKDYRGKSVLTSFEVFSFFDTDWLITAKIDEDEVVTEIYRNNPEKFTEELYSPVNVSGNTPILFDETNRFVAVDMDEYKRIDTNEVVFTKSIYTCTGVLINYPGRFSYLLHLSPEDRVYGGNKTDLINKVLENIYYKEIKEIEKQNLKFTVIATTKDAVAGIVDQLIENDILLSQIEIVFNPHALFADFYYDFKDNNRYVSWQLKDQEKNYLTNKLEVFRSLGQKIQKQEKFVKHNTR
ncbi:MAG: hypothetical protein C0594_09780 [Marinilabiliales bacterium]|nr:MAG: hypothetical protein C0594_09780 [Marinilabiliales bacterium]